MKLDCSWEFSGSLSRQPLFIECCTSFASIGHGCYFELPKSQTVRLKSISTCPK
jgi:hypothetical protein